MAQVKVVTYIDDISGEAAEDVATIEYVWEGIHYEIDLSQAHREKYQGVIQELVNHSRKVRAINLGKLAGNAPTRSATPSAPGTRSPVDREQNTAIREWANQHGFEVSPRGRIPAKVLEAFYEEHNRN